VHESTDPDQPKIVVTPCKQTPGEQPSGIMTPVANASRAHTPRPPLSDDQMQA
jgi:hypothetical protein